MKRFVIALVLCFAAVAAPAAADSHAQIGPPGEPICNLNPEPPREVDPLCKEQAAEAGLADTGTPAPLAALAAGGLGSALIGVAALRKTRKAAR